MRNTIVRCGQCSGALRLPEATGAGTLSCRSCSSETRVWLFPALHRERNAEVPLALQDEAHSGCMNHPQKRAVAVCDDCGKFLCALCDVDWNGQHLCPTCIGHRKNTDAGGALRSEYIHYDSVALLLALVAIPTSFFGLVIAPVAIFIGLRYWKAPLRPVPYWRWRMVTAIVLAALVFMGWGSLIAFMIYSAWREGM